jgi:polar amino acid transport system substrate-binding protein
MKRVPVLVLCLWTIFLLAAPARGLEPVSFVSVDWQPYAGELLPEYGVGSAIIAAVCQRAGFEPSFHFMPWKRAMEDVDKGKHDALYSAYSSSRRERRFAVSEPYLYGRLVLCARKSSKVAWDGTLGSLRPYRLGVVLGYVNTPAIDRSDFLQKDMAPSDLLNLKKLLSGRLDAIVIDQFQAVYLLKNNPVLESGLADVEFLRPPLERKGIHVMFSRQKPGWKQRLARFNRGLEEIRRDGTLQRIMDKFGFLLPDEGE